jgi:hypothetical protein
MRIRMTKRSALAILRLVALPALLVVPLTALARFPSPEFQIYSNLPYNVWAGGVGFAQALPESYAVCLAEEQRIEGQNYLQGLVVWYAYDSGWFATRWLDASQPSDSTVPDVACAQPDCLFTWVREGRVYARRDSSAVASGGPVWQVMAISEAVASVVATGPANYIVAWDTGDGRIGIRTVDPTAGPTGFWFYLTKPYACNKLSDPRIAYNVLDNTIFAAFSCFDEGRVYVQSINYSTAADVWEASPTGPAGSKYAPDLSTDGHGNAFLVWEQTGASVGSQIYGQRFDPDGNPVGSAAAVAPSSESQHNAELAYDSAYDEYLVVFDQADDVYYQRLTSGGARRGDAYAVTTADQSQLIPHVAYGDSKYLIAWTDERSSWENVYGRWMEPEQILGAGDPFSNETLPGDTDYYQAPAQANHWQAIALRPGSNSDFDIFLTDGPDYGNVLASSTNFTGTVDVVLMDGHQAGKTAYFPFAQQYGGDYYTVEYAASSGQITEDNDSSDQSMDVESVARMFDLYALAGQQLSVQVSPGVSDLGLALFAPAGGAHQGLNQAAASANAGGPAQTESLVYVPAETGWYGLLVWKNDENADSIHLEVEGAGLAVHRVYLPLILR